MFVWVKNMIKVENKVYYSINMGKKLIINDKIQDSIGLSVYRTVTDIKKLAKFLEDAGVLDYQILKLEVTGNVDKKDVKENIVQYSLDGVAKVIEILDYKKI